MLEDGVSYEYVGPNTRRTCMNVIMRDVTRSYTTQSIVIYGLYLILLASSNSRRENGWDTPHNGREG